MTALLLTALLLAVRARPIDAARELRRRRYCAEQRAQAIRFFMTGGLS